MKYVKERCQRDEKDEYLYPINEAIAKVTMEKHIWEAKYRASSFQRDFVLESIDVGYANLPKWKTQIAVKLIIH